MTMICIHGIFLAHGISKFQNIHQIRHSERSVMVMAHLVWLIIQRIQVLQQQQFPMKWKLIQQYNQQRN